MFPYAHANSPPFLFIKKIFPISKRLFGNIFYLIFQNGFHFAGFSTLLSISRLPSFFGPVPSASLDKLCICILSQFCFFSILVFRYILIILFYPAICGQSPPLIIVSLYKKELPIRTTPFPYLNKLFNTYAIVPNDIFVRFTFHNNLRCATFRKDDGWSPNSIIIIRHRVPICSRTRNC